MRTEQQIQEEIAKVEQARRTALKGYLTMRVDYLQNSVTACK